MNPFDPGYLTSTSATFGSFAWVFFALQIVGFVAGLYLVFLRKDTNPVRKIMIQWIGTVLVVSGGVGIILGDLRLNGIVPFTQRAWFFGLLVVELVLAGIITYYVRLVYPSLVAQSKAASRGKSGKSGKSAPRSASARASSSPSKPASSRQAAQSGNGKAAASSSASSNEPAAARSGRRDARQRRKRKQRH